jgi:hypothetical protein
MQYMKCKCGKSECWTSMGHPSCDVCEDCGSTLGYGPNSHPEQTPHEPYAELERGKIVVKCVRCRKPCDLKDAKNLEAFRAEIAAASAALAEA